MPGTKFNPALHGFHFSNNDISWSFGPFSGKFLCGGMAYAALDYFYKQISIPANTQAPAPGTTLHSYIYNRQVTAHGNTWGPFAGAWLPVFGVLATFAESFNVDNEYDKLVTILASGTPVPIGLVRVGGGHHIVAVGCSGAPPQIIVAYDPNVPHVTVIIRRLADGRFFNTQSGDVWEAFFVDDGYKVKTPPVMAGQGNWRWCRKCQGLFFFGNVGNGVCPVGGFHDVVGSGNYLLSLDAGNGQPDWRWCSACQGLFFGGNAGGICPATGIHVKNGSGNYTLSINGGVGQPNWLWCRVCDGLFFAGNGSLGVCPGNSNGHDGSFSSNYFLPMFSG